MKLLQSSLARQIMGAIVGAAVAYVAYLGYQSVSPHLRAYIQVYHSQQPARLSQTDIDESDEQYQRRAQRNEEIANMRGAAPVPTDAEPEDDLLERIANQAKQIEERLTEEDVQQLGTDEAVLPESETSDGVLDASVTDTQEEILPEPEVPATTTPQPEQWQEQLGQMERVPYEGENPLPDSGIGLWLGVLGALAATAVMQRRRILELCSREERA
ncbi:MAG: hypothetical protein WCX61_04795 [Candidatus Peribacteraceae bacterium]